MTDLATTPHRRFNALTGQWVLVSPHRTARPWQGQTEETSVDSPDYVEDCYLCPGNARANGDRNPNYDDVFVFDNDFPALLPDSTATPDSHPLFVQQAVTGTCRVVCYSPRHNETMATMPVSGIGRVIDCWAEQQEELGRDYRWVQIFENRGAVMGCSNPHPHGQIWALNALPTEASAELNQQHNYWKEQGTSLLLDYAAQEIERAERVLIHNQHWLVVVPYWAVWPFETLVLPTEPVSAMDQLTPPQRSSLAQALHDLCRAYDRLFNTSFPYSMGWHSAPTDRHYPEWQLHGHFYPPLLRSATIKKFMVGFEMLGEPQRDLTPEAACQALRKVMT